MDQVHPAFNTTSGTVNKREYKNQLDIQLHEDGLLRCHGRMVHAELPPDAVSPIHYTTRNSFIPVFLIRSLNSEINIRFLKEELK